MSMYRIGTLARAVKRSNAMRLGTMHSNQSVNNYAAICRSLNNKQVIMTANWRLIDSIGFFRMLFPISDSFDLRKQYTSITSTISDHCTVKPKTRLILFSVCIVR